MNSSSSKISFVLFHKGKSILIIDDYVCRSNKISITMKYRPCKSRMHCKGITDLKGVLLKINGNHSYVIDIEKQTDLNVQPNYQIECYQRMHSYTKYVHMKKQRNPSRQKSQKTRLNEYNFWTVFG